MHRQTIISIFAVAVTMMAGIEMMSAQIRHTLSKASPLYRKDTVTICVMGDMMMHTAQIENAHRFGNWYDFSSYFSHIRDKIEGTDLAIANMEFTLAGEPYSGYPSFSAPDCYAEYLADCGFDVFLAANNHIFDKGSEGAARTLAVYKELGRKHGIRYCGLSATQNDYDHTYPLTINIKGINIAIVNFTYGTNLGADKNWPKVNYMNDRNALKTALDKASEADFTLVIPHWGEEYQMLHSEKQKETAEWLVANGADMIIGTHPHVVQDCGNIEGIQVAYSLGNAVSNMSAANTQIGLMAEIKIVREYSGDITILPLEFTWLWCSRPGGYSNSYTVLPVSRHLNMKKDWKGGWEHDKMTATYERVRQITGINTLYYICQKNQSGLKPSTLLKSTEQQTVTLRLYAAISLI